MNKNSTVSLDSMRIHYRFDERDSSSLKVKCSHSSGRVLSVSEMKVSILQRVLPGIPGLKLKQVKYCLISRCPSRPRSHAQFPRWKLFNPLFPLRLAAGSQPCEFLIKLELVMHMQFCNPWDPSGFSAPLSMAFSSKAWGIVLQEMKEEGSG